MSLLSRDEFREAVFGRDGRRCVVCREPAKDAHHVVERRLWPNGGYFVENGVSLCEDHHLLAEQTVLSCEDLRRAAGIQKTLLPPQFYADERIDKWGNAFLWNGLRMRGELFDDESVQQILPDSVKVMFTSYVKYPRTWHFPDSPAAGEDDGERRLQSDENFHGQEVVVSVKMDGENTTLYRDYMHARSADSQTNPTRHWMQNFHAKIGWEIPEGWRLCGENLYAKHSIFYDNLETYFMLFSAWDDRNFCQSWDETETWAKLLGVTTVPVLYRGPYDGDRIRALWQPTLDGCEMEGYVCRLARGYHYREFPKAIAKWVRKGHVKTNEHWSRTWTPNKLRDA